jgi:hypothetical protein
MSTSYQINDRFLVETFLPFNPVGLTNLEQAFNLVQNQLSSFANLTDFQEKIDSIFGKKNNINQVNLLQDAWQNSDFSIIPTIEIISDSDLNGANGAFSIQKMRIYLSESLINSANLSLIASVLLEEIGHAVDGRLNQSDSLGDEGAIFSALVRGETLNPQQLGSLKAEDDTATITLDGQVVEIEQNASTNVSEIGDYTQIYQLDIPNDAAFGATGNPAYSVNNSAIVFPGGIDRIGYYLELDTGSGSQWVWVSMDAFTQDLTKIGVPTRTSGAFWQQIVNNMNIESNVIGILTGQGITTGNIEFWPYDYLPQNAVNIPGANSSTYDFGDQSFFSNNYASMQIHNYGAGQTLFAWNAWGFLGGGYGLSDDLGIGNNIVITPDGRVNPDWTYRGNANNYTIKNLEVWVEADENINLIENGNFETPDITNINFVIYTTPPSNFVWSIINSNVDLINSLWNGGSGTLNSDGYDQSVDIDNNAILSQSFATEPGKTYYLSFQYSHNPNEQGGGNPSSIGYVRVIGDSELVTETLIHDDPLTTFEDMRFRLYTINFTADSSLTTLQFQGDLSNEFYGFVVDDVKVEAEAVNTPPTTSNNTLTIDEDTDRIFVTTDFNFSDVDTGDVLQEVRVDSLPTEGILYLDTNSNSIIDTDEAIMTGDRISVAAINAGQFKFKPDADENGIPYSSFNFLVSDGVSFSDSTSTMTLDVIPDEVDIVVSTDFGRGADTFIFERDFNSNYGFWSELVVKNDDFTASNVHNRKPYVRFDLSSANDLLIQNARLSLTFLRTGESGPKPTFTYSVYGLNDNLPGENWDESTITWNNAPGNGRDSTINPNQTTFLGTFSLNPSTTPQGTIINFSDSRLISFLQNDTNDLVTFIIRRNQVNSTGETFASKENSEFEPPKLRLEIVSLPTVSISPTTISQPEGNSGTTAYTYTVSLSNPSSQIVTVNYSTNDGTATVADGDYIDNDGILTFNPGNPLSQEITVLVNGDIKIEPDKTFTLKLTETTGSAILGNQNTATLTILNDDVQLNFNAANYTVREDGTAVTDVIITRTGRTTGTVGATLNFDNGTATGCPCPPASVTYDFYNGAFAFTLGDNEISKIIRVEDAKLAGSNAIRIRNDSKVEGDETFTINLTNPTGGATIGNQNNATVTILDDDVELAFSAPNFTIREDGTAIAAVTVNRIGRLTGVVGATINLDGGSATYPDDYTQTSLDISFAERENSKTVNIPVRNDIISESDEIVNLTLVNPTGGATLGSQNIATLTIVDNGLIPSLSLAIDKDIIAENAGNNAATATITRSIVTDEDLIVTLASNNTSEITVPNQVIIPANQASATFSLSAVDDNIPDGIQTVTITATANGFSQGVDTINVADINVPDLKIVNLSASTPLLTGKQGSFTYRVINQGLSDAKGTWTDKIYLSTDTTLETNKDIFLDNYQFSGTIPPGLFYERNLPFFIPKTHGQYYLIAQTDTANTINEGIGLGEGNNTTITSINITPAYRATVSTDTEIGVTGNKVILQGKTFSNVDNSAVPYEFVTIAIKYNGTVRELTAFTDKNGNFVKDFQPLPGEGGQYQINAYFPGYSSEDTTAEDSFKLLGMRFNTGGAYYQINANSPFNATATLQNLTDIPITGITYTVNGAPQDWNIQVNAANTLAGNTNLPISYTITAPNNSPITQDTFNINLTSAEGVSTTLPVTINLRRIVPHLVANTNLLSNGMLRGQQTPIEFEVTNNGGIATGEVKVILPDAPWLKLASPVTLSSLNPGESSKVTLLLTPDTNLPLTVYNGNLVLDVVGNDGDLSLPFSFRAVSDAVGSLQISVVDELTFFTESAPKLKDATIILRDYVTGNEVRRITTDTTGIVSWDNLAEGYYQLEVQAKNHDSYTQTIQIKAGETEDIESFLSRQTVKYVWRVVPTEIEDKYTITIESVVETNVPALDGSSGSIANPIPTVTIDPPLIDLVNLQIVGQMMQVDMTVTNNGLIAANNVRLYFGEHPFYKIEPLIENIGTLGAKSSMTIPVTITRIGDFENPENNGLKTLAATAQPNIPCKIDAKLIYDYICGVFIDKNGEKFNRNIEKSIPIAFPGVEGNCPADLSLSLPFTNIVSLPFTNIGGLPNNGSNFNIISEIPNAIAYDFSNCSPCLRQYFDLIKTAYFTAVSCSPVGIVSCLTGLVQCSLEVAETESPVAEDLLTCTKSLFGCVPVPVYQQFLCVLSIVELVKKLQIWREECQQPIPGLSANSIMAQENLSLQTDQLLNSLDSNSETEQVDIYLERLEKIIDAYAFLFGDEIWLQEQDPTTLANWINAFLGKIENTTQESLKISTDEKNELLSLPLPTNLTGTDINKFIDRWNRTIEYWNAQIYTPNDVPEGESLDFIDLDSMQDTFSAAKEAIEQTQADGFSDVIEGIQYHLDALKDSLEANSGGVCAQVKLQINQDAIMTRSAFLGTLEIDNDNDTTNLENLTVTINIKDSQGNSVNDLFGITNPILSNINAVDGTGTLLANSSGSAEWTFIPTGIAAPNEPTVYSIGGSLSYKENGNFLPLSPSSHKQNYTLITSINAMSLLTTPLLYKSNPPFLSPWGCSSKIKVKAQQKTYISPPHNLRLLTTKKAY